MTAWLLPQPIAPPADLLALTGDPLLAELLARRGLLDAAQADAFLHPEHYRPAPPTALPDVPAAVERLSRAIAQQEHICVWGDFDVDGQTSTTLLVQLLQTLGARVSYYIPNRLTESHGIKLPSLRQRLDEGLNLLLTCDTGVAEHAAVDAANAAGVDVIITDHHDLPDALPPAAAVINPKRLPADHPLRELPGVGVAFKLAQALLAAHGREPDAELLLDLVALGIVADVARQTADTRYLLQRGLDALQNTPRLGLRALLESANLHPDRLTEDHIGFWLGPRLNALGRLGDANLAVELLTTTDLTRARTLALQLEALNDRRKLLVDKVVVQALSQLEETPSLAAYHGVVLAAEEWHPGVIGIAASRLVDQTGKPAVLIALRPDGLGRGSARSVPGCDIHQAIQTQAHLLRNFGGHPMAAGLGIEPQNIGEFRRGLSAALAGCAPAAKSIAPDLLVTLPQISADLLRTLQRLAPFGAGNPPVLLATTGLHLLDDSTFGKTGAHRRLTVADDAGHSQSVIWWGGAGEPLPQGQFDLAFRLSPDDYRGGDAVQVELHALREWQPAPTLSQVEFLDWRQEPNPQSKLFDLLQRSPEGYLQRSEASSDAERSHLRMLPPQFQLWAEGDFSPALETAPRHRLQPAETLVIWSTPPGQDIFRQVIGAVRPQRVILVAQPSPLDALSVFVRQLMGLAKYAIEQKEGEVVPEELAAALGHRAATARLALDWLAAQGKLVITVDEPEVLVVRAAANPPRPADAAAIGDMLAENLAETAAFRRFFRRAGLRTLQTMAGGTG